MARPRSFDENTVLATIQEVFWRQGFAATSIEDLEKATGLKRTSLYQAFGNKDQLYITVLQNYQRANAVEVEQLVEANENPLLALRSMLEKAVEQAIADPDQKGCFVVNAATERSCLCETIANFTAENREKVVRNFAALLRKAQQQGHQLPQPPTDLANYLFAFYGGLMTMSKTGASAASLRAALSTGLSWIN